MNQRLVNFRLDIEEIESLDEFVENDPEFTTRTEAVRWAINMMQNRWRVQE